MPKRGDLLKAFGLAPKRRVFETQKDFALFCGTTPKTISLAVNKNRIKTVDDAGRKIIISKHKNKVNCEYAFNFLYKKGWDRDEIIDVVYGKNFIGEINGEEIKTTETEIKETEIKELIKKKVPQKTGPKTKKENKNGNESLFDSLRSERLKKYIEDDLDPSKLTELSMPEIDHIIKIKKFQGETLKVKAAEFALSESKGEAVAFSSMQYIFNSILDLIALQVRSGVGRGFGKKILNEFNRLEAKDPPATKTEMIGVLDKFHGDFSDGLLKTLLREIENLLKKEKIL